MFGRSSSLPIDLMFPVDVGVTKENLYQNGKIKWMKPYKLHNERQTNQLSKIEISLTENFMEMT